MSMIDQHGGRITQLPNGAEYFLLVDLRACEQTPQQARRDLSRVPRNYSGQGEVRGFGMGYGSSKDPGARRHPRLLTQFLIR
jgi:hypothetical protein